MANNNYEIAAIGAIAMGLGGYLAARADQEHFASEEQREAYEIVHMREQELAEVREVFAGYGLSGVSLDTVVNAIAADDKRWIDFMMKFELGLERPDPKRAPISATTIAGSYFVGGLIPLLPYMLAPDLQSALRASILCAGAALLAFGAVKGRLTGVDVVKAAVQTALVGGVAASAAFYLASLFS